MSEFSYVWYQYRLQVSCDKCGKPIVFQDMEGLPECNDCGESSRHSWLEAMQFCGIGELARGDVGNKHLMGFMTATSNSEAAASINCHHCKKSIVPAGDIVFAHDHACEHCSEKLVFQPLKDQKGMVLYRYVNQKIGSANSLIAVRCASCGAPLEVNPDKTNYPCTFCKVENILPPSMRQKRVLDDIFIGVQKKVLSLSELLESNDPNAIVATLNTRHASNFKDDDLNTIMLKFINNETVFNLLLYKIGYVFPVELHEKIWQTSKMPALIAASGKKLGKSSREISDQQDRFAYGKAKKTEAPQKSLLHRIKSLFGA